MSYVSRFSNPLIFDDRAKHQLDPEQQVSTCQFYWLLKGGFYWLVNVFLIWLKGNIFTYLKILPDVLLHLSISLVKFFVLHCLMLNWSLLKWIYPAITVILDVTVIISSFPAKKPAHLRIRKESFILVTNKQDICNCLPKFLNFATSSKRKLCVV